MQLTDILAQMGGWPVLAERSDPSEILRTVAPSGLPKPRLITWSRP